MVDAVFDGDVSNAKRLDAFQATDVEAVLLLVCTALMVQLDLTVASQVVLGWVGV